MFDELRERTQTQEIETGTGARTLPFGRVNDFQSLLTDRRVELVQSLIDEPAGSISELAERVDRNYRSVDEDIQVLRNYDIVYFGEGKGQGKRPFVPYEKIELGGTLAKVAA